jgi:hypothetical protein
MPARKLYSSMRANLSIGDVTTIQLTIVTWNLGYPFRRHQHTLAWNYLATDIHPHIALVQEARPPDTRAYFKHQCWRKIGGTRDWGSGIVTTAIPLRELRFSNTYPGAVIAADCAS